MSHDDMNWLRLVADNVPVNIAYLDAEHRYRFVNENVERHYGLRKEEIIGKHAIEIQGEEVYRRFLPHIEAGLRGEEVTFEQELAPFDGRQRDYLFTYRPHFAENNEVAGLYIIVVDITDRKRAEAELQRNVIESELLRQIAVKSNEAATADEAIQMCLDEVCAYSGWPVGHAYMSATDGTGELETTKLWHIDDPEQYENLRRVTEAIRYTYDQSLPSRVRAEAATQWMVSDTTYQHMPRANARIEAGLKSGFAFPAMAGKNVVAVLEFFSPEAIEPDPQFLSITAEVGILIGQVIERRQTEQALRDREQALADSETRYRQLAELSPDGMLVHIDGEIVFANASLAQILAYPSPEDLLGKNTAELLAPEYRASMEQRRKKVLKGEISASAQVEFVRSDGSRVSVERSASQISWEGNSAIVVLFRDISERLAAEKAVVESRDQLRLIADNLPVLIAYFDAQLHYRFVNKTGSEWLARPAVELIGRTVSAVLGQEYDKVRSRIDEALAGEQQTYVDSITYPDGVTRTVRGSYIPHFGAAGSVEGYFTLVEDISELQQAEEALRQAQKMEAVGQLTGGVAHDFNNLLAVILGNTELLGDEIGDHSMLASIDHAATRGAELTQRLLAFSRQQALQPQSIDLTELLPSLERLFQRTLGEPIKILTAIPEEIWPVTADPGQLENALLNLSINARAAMPSGGILQIKCENVRLQDGNFRVADEVPEGDYVQIAVSDTGTGMSEGVLEHAFEPFYTTKEVGEGSGLGLSMVHGFARQSGGDAVIESTPGTGTEVRIFLPRSEEITESEERKQEARKRGSGEAILVLEDDPNVRNLAVTILDGLGYRVREAADANAAMRVLEEEADNIDLLLSDVVLPGGVSGPELAAKAKELYPKLKLVFMSGYPADLYTDDKIPGFDETLLTKPFRLAELAKVIRDTLAA